MADPADPAAANPEKVTCLENEDTVEDQMQLSAHMPCITPNPLVKSTGSNRSTPSPIDSRVLFNAAHAAMQQARKLYLDTQLTGDGSSQAPDVAAAESATESKAPKKALYAHNTRTYTNDQMGPRQPGGQAFR